MTATFNSTIALPKPPIKQAKLYINGQWRSASDGKTRPTISPIHKTAIADIPEASEQDDDSEHEGTPQTDSLHDSSVDHALIAIAQEVAQLLKTCLSSTS